MRSQRCCSSRSTVCGLWARTIFGTSGESPAKAALKIAAATPEVVDPHDMKRLALFGQRARFVLQNLNAARSQRLGYGMTEVPVAANSQSVANGEIVVSQHSEDAVGGLQISQAMRHRLHITITDVNEIAGEHDDVRPLGMGQRDGFLEVSAGNVPAGVEV